MTEEIKLKPCPFCGGEATLKYVDDKTWQVVCADCGAYSDYYCEEFDINNPPEGNEAVKAWNDRKPLNEFLPSNSIEFMVKFYKELGKVLVENKQLKKRNKRLSDLLNEIGDEFDKDEINSFQILRKIYETLRETENADNIVL